MSWLVAKPVLLFIFGYTLIHIMGKHHIGNTTLLDFLVAIVLGNILAQPILSDNVGPTFIYGGLLVATYLAFSRLILVNPLRKLLTFKPTMLVVNGVIDMKALKRERITMPHLLAEFRLAGYPSLDDVHYAILEETGRISVIPKADKRPVQPSDFSMTPADEGMPVTLVVDGEIIHKNFSIAKRDREWFDSQLAALGIEEGVKRISLATFFTGSGRLRLDVGNNIKNI
jgi:uncharacterized membrane protein YcaP (DUF421 family)